MKSINVEKINSEVSKFISERDWDQFHSNKNLAMALSVETSELVEIFQWLKECESNDIASNSILKEKLEDEIADIFVYLMRIAIKSDIDIEEVTLRKIQKNAKKYPIEKAKGSAKKYTEL
ncbi:nucleotide pyrophosphohydrolase [Halobacteriovorax sp. RT-1-4]|uniref:nucleotide pyrophosphohydrolase n=1 Tax=unclassified Halobacteriovorax TaxID=2639665 RepID=UPI00399BED86